MKKIARWLLTGLAMPACLTAQQLHWKLPATTSGPALAAAMPALARQVLHYYKNDGTASAASQLLRLQIVAGEYATAVGTIQAYRGKEDLDKAGLPELGYLQFELFSRAMEQQAKTKKTFTAVFPLLFKQAYVSLNDKAAFYAAQAFVSKNGIAELEKTFLQMLNEQKDTGSITLSQALALCNLYCQWQVYKAVEPAAAPLIAADDRKRYLADSVLIPAPGGGQLAAIVVRKKNNTTRQPAALVFTIYAEKNSANTARAAAAHGYVGVIAFSRGKAWSRDSIVPYEREVTDVNTVISWITQQSWSDGRVGMYGGSYNGFTQWAATKHLHPALKTIVPYVAAIPGIGLPMENNIFLNANYGWAFYVTHNRYVDESVYASPGRWRTMQRQWYNSGVAYRKIDSIDGEPNPWLQRWLQHPAYDAYWQAMVPWREEFARISIPVLTIEGYYDDGQLSGLRYLKEHYRYNPQAQHYLLIGPYDHFGTQRGGSAVLRGYTVDPVALINTREITFEWFDYIFRGGRKPALLKDHINYEVMGANEWRHAPSLEKMANDTLTLYLTTQAQGRYYHLSALQQHDTGYLTTETDLADRTNSSNDYYPDPIIRDSLDHSSGLFFISDPFQQPVTVNGCFAGQLVASVSKKDMDIGVVLYELLPDGRFFHLSYFLGRASYAGDITTRHLLEPGKRTAIPFDQTRMVSKQLEKGSRLVVVLNINKNAFAQVNYGTGKEVSDETIHDAGEPLQVKWFSNSYIKIPVWQ